MQPAGARHTLHSDTYNLYLGVAFALQSSLTLQKYILHLLSGAH